MWKVVRTAALAISIAGGCASVDQSSGKASDERKAKWLEDWSEWRGIVLPDVAGTDRKVVVRAGSVDAATGDFELNVRLLTEEVIDREQVNDGIYSLVAGFCDAWRESSSVAMSGVEEFELQNKKDGELNYREYLFEFGCDIDGGITEYRTYLLTEEWPEWHKITTSVVGYPAKQDSLVKVIWKDREQSTIEVLIRIESGWIGIPDMYVRRASDGWAEEFCRNVAHKRLWLFVDHSKEATRERGKLVRRDHVFVYQCKDPATAPARLTEEWPEWTLLEIKNVNAPRNGNTPKKQNALVKAVWSKREQLTFEISVRIESGSIEMPGKRVRIGLADSLADEFCKNIAGKPSWLFVSRYEESHRRRDKLVRRDHVFVYQCEDGASGNAGASGPDRTGASAPSG